jgi:hypothetical protein
MTRIGSLQGTYLGVYPAKTCEYWLESPKEQCRFCSVGLNLGADDADEKSVQEVVEVVRAASPASSTSTSTPATTTAIPTSTSWSPTSWP